MEKINLDKVKKILTIVSISAVSVVAFMLILAVFKVNVFANIPLRIMLVIATLGVGSGIAINELNVIKRKKILGYVGLALLCVSILCALIIFCTDLLTSSGVFVKITLILTILSLTFITIISYYSKLGKSAFVVQIIAYVCLAIIALILSILVAGYNLLQYNIIRDMFIVLCIVLVALLITLTVLSSRKKGVEVENKPKKDMIMISKVEYENLLKENEELKQELAKLKNQND